MMSKYKIILSIFLLSGLVAFNANATRKSQAKVNVVKASALTNATTNSVAYTLPKTVLQVEVEIEKRINKVGPFYRYSEKYLNLSKTITDDSETYQLKSIKITPIGKPNFDQTYLIQMDGAGTAQNININELGVLCGINLPSAVKCNMSQSISLQSTKIADITFDGVPFLEKQLLKTSTAAMAEEAANYIYKIRKRKMKIFSVDFDKSPTPPDGEAYRLIDNELDTLETMFVELFAGKTVRETIKQTFEYTPDLKGQERRVLFRFSEKSGALDRMDLSGTPVYIEAMNIDKIQLPEGEIDPKKIKSVGLYIVNPGLAMVKIIDQNKTIIEQEFQIAQFGQVVSLPASVLEREEAQIELSPVTGALLKIGHSNK